MKRTVFIIIGIVLVLVLVAIWVYVLFFGTPSNNIYTDLNFGDTTDTTVTTGDTVDTTDQPTIDVSGPERLRQLTTKPVAGYQEVLYATDSTPGVFYIEQGTGHIYSINLASGEEKRLSGTTIKESVYGGITPNGRYVMIQSGKGVGSEVIVGKISSSTEAINSHPITENIVDFTTTDNNTFLYAVQTGNSLIGKEYFPISDTSETLFTVPFREATVNWGNTAAATHYAYPKASSQLEGFVYQIKNGQLKRLPIDGFGLSAAGNDSLVLYSKQVKGLYQTALYGVDSATSKSLSRVVIPEKCASLHTGSTVVCAAAFTNYESDLPEAWYKGVISYSDDLWSFTEDSFSYTSMVLLAQIEKESGRQLDIVGLIIGKNDANLYFTNKNDQTLWLYELTSNGAEFEGESSAPII